MTSLVSDCGDSPVYLDLAFSFIYLLADIIVDSYPAAIAHKLSKEKHPVLKIHSHIFVGGRMREGCENWNDARVIFSKPEEVIRNLASLRSYIDFEILAPRLVKRSKILLSRVDRKALNSEGQKLHDTVAAAHNLIN